MKIRKSTYHDAPFIKLLFQDLGLPTTVGLLVSQLTTLYMDSDHEVWVYEDRDMVTGFTILHTLPRLGSEGNLLVVSCVAGNDRSTKDALERHIEVLAQKRNAERINI